MSNRREALFETTFREPDRPNVVVTLACHKTETLRILRNLAERKLGSTTVQVQEVLTEMGEDQEERVVVGGTSIKDGLWTWNLKPVRMAKQW